MHSNNQQQLGFQRLGLVLAQIPALIASIQQSVVITLRKPR
jgi:hypothetical protein